MTLFIQQDRTFLWVITLLGVFITAAPARAQTFTVLYTFTDTANGQQPDAGLLRDSSNNLFGTTQYGGTEGGFGTVFELDANGDEKVLHSFAGTPDAEDPYAPVIHDKTGDLYGTTIYGGTAGGFGTIFKLDSANKEAILYSFAGTPDGDDPYGGLVRDSKGNLYGTTIFGGTAGGFGTVFKLSFSGKLALLHSFAGTPDGEDPYGGLVRNSEGILFGTTLYGGNAGGYGTVFKLDKASKLILLHSFSGTPDGENPHDSLVRDGDGNLYGTTIYGGQAGGYGTVFKISAAGKLTLLHSFSGNPDGVNPYGALVQDRSGNLYGTTFHGGTNGYGTVFKVTKAGKLTVLHSFNYAPDGANPIGGLILDKQGNLYGTTSSGGDTSCGFNGCGTVFEITP
jgi:uncharacterized repeat protein (TIGR03803 family)